MIMGLTMRRMIHKREINKNLGESPQLFIKKAQVYHPKKQFLHSKTTILNLIILSSIETTPAFKSHNP